jgi:DNA-binding transcriptional ArsR family regulator
VAQVRAGVRDYTAGSASYKVEFDVRPVYDFLLSLEIADGEDKDLLPEDARWLSEARASLTTEQRAYADEFFGLDTKAVGIHIAGLAFDRPEARDSASFVEIVRNCRPRDVAEVLIQEIIRYEDLGELFGPALDGDHDAQAQLETALPEKVRPPVMAVLNDMDGTAERLVRILEAWQERFQSLEPRVARMIQHDAEGRQGDLATLEAPDVLERTTGGIRLLAEPRIRRVVLAPSYFIRPYNFIFSADDWRLFCYPIAESVLDSSDGSMPPKQIVRLYRALGDETRMRILKLLTDRDRYLTELAQDLELSKPTVKHHLSQLRAAGVVTMTEEGSLTYYSLRRERLEEAGVELGRYLA